ncbi:MAG TPA: hypothetical protein ENH12_03980 [Proteobacteria bacterium]|nr:hypothetical protein [Pseudomonadota bacterium]
MMGAPSQHSNTPIFQNSCPEQSDGLCSMKHHIYIKSILILASILMVMVGSGHTEPRRDRTTFNLGPTSRFPPGTVKHLIFYDAYIISDDEGIYALSSICPFRGGPTFKTDKNDAFVCRRCKSRYGLDGRVIRGPSHDPLNWLKMELGKTGDIFLFRKYRGGKGKKILHKILISNDETRK